jgi:hypothetical protein
MATSQKKEHSMATFEPWARSPGKEPEQRRLAQLFGAVPEPDALDEAARARVRRRLSSPARGRPSLVLLRLVAVGAVLGMVGAAAAQWAAQRLLVPRQPHVAERPVPQVSVVPQPVLPRGRATLPDGVADSIPHPETVPTSEEAPAPVPRGSAAASRVAAAPSSSRLGLEARSLEAALKLLRSGNAALGLQALDRHVVEFQGGTLDLEAQVARVDALLLLGRRQDARRALNTLPLERVGRRQELRLIRAELTADHDCRRALDDFRTLSEQPLPTAWAERVLYGRGACLRKLGDEAGAARDFDLYLERFPSGRFAAQLRTERGR